VPRKRTEFLELGGLAGTEVGLERETVVGILVGTVLGVESLAEILYSMNGLHSAGEDPWWYQAKYRLEPQLWDRGLYKSLSGAKLRCGWREYIQLTWTRGFERFQ
jgi:hypothetical protein